MTHRDSHAERPVVGSSASSPGAIVHSEVEGPVSGLVEGHAIATDPTQNPGAPHVKPGVPVGGHRIGAAAGIVRTQVLVQRVVVDGSGQPGCIDIVGAVRSRTIGIEADAARDVVDHNVVTDDQVGDESLGPGHCIADHRHVIDGDASRDVFDDHRRWPMPRVFSKCSECEACRRDGKNGCNNHGLRQMLDHSGNDRPPVAPMVPDLANTKATHMSSPFAMLAWSIASDACINDFVLRHLVCQALVHGSQAEVTRDSALESSTVQDVCRPRPKHSS